MKIDVEGHEEAVLDGARKTLARCRPRVLVELDERLAPGAIERATEFFRAQGYAGYFIFQRQLLPIVRFDRHVMQRPENLPDLTAGPGTGGRSGWPDLHSLHFSSASPA